MVGTFYSFHSLTLWFVGTIHLNFDGLVHFIHFSYTDCLLLVSPFFFHSSHLLFYWLVHFIYSSHLLFDWLLHCIHSLQDFDWLVNFIRSPHLHFDWLVNFIHSPHLHFDWSVHLIHSSPLQFEWLIHFFLPLSYTLIGWYILFTLWLAGLTFCMIGTFYLLLTPTHVLWLVGTFYSLLPSGPWLVGIFFFLVA
jgi:hypothetical protein